MRRHRDDERTWDGQEGEDDESDDDSGDDREDADMTVMGGWRCR